MIMIIGGYAQGKAAYARKHYTDADRHMLRLNELVRDCTDRAQDVRTVLQERLRTDPDCILLAEEIGNGIVPAEGAQRAFRDTIGRLQQELAAQADEVVRVICGIGQRLK